MAMTDALLDIVRVRRSWCWQVAELVMWHIIWNRHCRLPEVGMLVLAWTGSQRVELSGVALSALFWDAPVITLQAYRTEALQEMG
ncbi:MAG: hypothetical protein OXI41_01760 [Chloroflexota bacterium]|nr:hypothetical protein [Chloroflexota bacterium]MDE2894196.1 hypothetical protein [Chloroflexota bacterium]